MGGLAQSFGATKQASATFAEQTTRLAADLASFHNAAGGTEEVLNAMKSAFIHYDQRIRIIYDTLKPQFARIREETSPYD